MNEHTKATLHEMMLNDMGTTNYAVAAILLDLMRRLEILESAPMPELQQSGRTLPESSSVSPAETTEPLMDTATSVLTSSPSPPSPPLVDWETPQTQVQQSKTTERTYFSPSTERSTGPSVGSVEYDLMATRIKQFRDILRRVYEHDWEYCHDHSCPVLRDVLAALHLPLEVS